MGGQERSTHHSSWPLLNRWERTRNFQEWQQIKKEGVMEKRRLVWKVEGERSDGDMKTTKRGRVMKEQC
ncbi:unnamed protein product [Brassica napus]|uniref:(rape) hypothetical protein n=1 Tax=Brassica napus TaxID=3708 RepID=A0A816J4T0_BRANA|nr:unnamed protein product [Brassica napus]